MTKDWEFVHLFPLPSSLFTSSFVRMHGTPLSCGSFSLPHQGNETAKAVVVLSHTGHRNTGNLFYCLLLKTWVHNLSLAHIGSHACASLSHVAKRDSGSSRELGVELVSPNCMTENGGGVNSPIQGKVLVLGRHQTPGNLGSWSTREASRNKEQPVI